MNQTIQIFFTDAITAHVGELANGDIMLAGIANYNEAPFEIPILWRVSPEGELKWLRFVWREQEGVEYPKFGGIRNAVEDMNGDLYFFGGEIAATGPLTGLAKPFLMKTDSMGCLEPGCGYENVITGLREYTRAMDITLSPNPVTSKFSLRKDMEQYHVLDGNGRVLLSGKNYYAQDLINITDFIPGLYIFWGRDKEGISYIGKIVKH